MAANHLVSVCFVGRKITRYVGMRDGAPVVEILWMTETASSFDLSTHSVHIVVNRLSHPWLRTIKALYPKV